MEIMYSRRLEDRMKVDEDKIKEILKDDFFSIKCIHDDTPVIYIINIYKKRHGFENKNKDRMLYYMADLAFKLVDALDYTDVFGKDHGYYVFKELQ